MADDAFDFVPLGAAPRPDDGEELARRVRSALLDQAAGVTDASPVRVAATLDGAAVPTLDVDLTGVVVAGARKTPPPPAPVTARSSEAGIVGRLRVDAHPVTIEGVRVDLQAEAENLSFSWVEGVDGSLAAQLVEPTEQDRVVGQVRVAAARDEIVAAVQRVAADLAKAQGVTLSRLDVDLVSRGPRAASVAVRAQIRKGFLSATAEGGATATVGTDLVLTVSDVSVTSGNPLVAGMLAVASGRIKAYEGRRIDLGAQLPPGVRLVDVGLDVGDEVVLTARTG
ncbi:hypothetical protein IC607_02775 [Cellulomonas sp. JH27-2]|uniref:hypothetical protein n=1 Tax=Cellulomonas sp. JH27-2 TaxID=2774139 RepID=UPI0017866132|nr:hypothetical protein [Cellulomonas sp. JH27-2]MBD8057887.1 hypothetical protein [Cellulomonas sp. JH27-2]